MTKTIKAEHKHQNIRVSCLEPLIWKVPFATWIFYLSKLSNLAIISILATEFQSHYRGLTFKVFDNTESHVSLHNFRASCFMTHLLHVARMVWLKFQLHYTVQVEGLCFWPFDRTGSDIHPVPIHTCPCQQNHSVHEVSAVLCWHVYHTHGTS